jgi:hypothetical protein
MITLDPNARVLFLCHGRTHPRHDDRPVSKPDIQIWESAVYVDDNKYTLPDLSKPVTDLSKSTFKDKFDAVIAMYCPYSAYTDEKMQALSPKFFNNIVSWLKPGGVYITTGLPSNLFPILDKNNKGDLLDYNYLLMRLVDLKFSKSKTDQQRYKSHMQFIRASKDPDLMKVLHLVLKIVTVTVEKRSSGKLSKFKYDDKERKKAMKIFLKKVEDLTGGKLVPVKQMITDDSIVFRRNL